MTTALGLHLCSDVSSCWSETWVLESADLYLFSVGDSGMTPGHLCDVSIDCTLTPGVSYPAGGRAVCKNYIVREVTGATDPVGWLRWGIKWGPHEVNKAPIV